MQQLKKLNQSKRSWQHRPCFLSTQEASSPRRVAGQGHPAASPPPRQTCGGRDTFVQSTGTCWLAGGDAGGLAAPQGNTSLCLCCSSPRLVRDGRRSRQNPPQQSKLLSHPAWQGDGDRDPLPPVLLASSSFQNITGAGSSPSSRRAGAGEQELTPQEAGGWQGLAAGTGLLGGCLSQVCPGLPPATPPAPV